MLGETAERLAERYRGDFRRLRTTAGRDPEREWELLKEFKDVSDLGVDILFGEMQRSWPELRPFADRRALEAAARPGLPDDQARLSRLARGADSARSTGGLGRVDLDGAYDDVRRAAESPRR